MSYAKEYGLNVVIARLTQTIGAGISKDDNRYFAQLARSVIEGKDVILHTKGEPARNYCYLSDAISAILLLLVKGQHGQAYNVANENTYISARDLAFFVCDNMAGGKIKVVFDIPKDIDKFGYAPTSKIKMDCSKLKNLGWQPKFGLEEMYYRLIQSMKE